MSNQHPEIVDEAIAASMLGLSKSVMRKWRKLGVGPPFIRIGLKVIRYNVAELFQWLEQKKSGS